MRVGNDHISFEVRVVVGSGSVCCLCLCSGLGATGVCRVIARLALSFVHASRRVIVFEDVCVDILVPRHSARPHLLGCLRACVLLCGLSRSPVHPSPLPFCAPLAADFVTSVVSLPHGLARVALCPSRRFHSCLTFLFARTPAPLAYFRLSRLLHPRPFPASFRPSSLTSRLPCVPSPPSHPRSNPADVTRSPTRPQKLARSSTSRTARTRRACACSITWCRI